PIAQPRPKLNAAILCRDSRQHRLPHLFCWIFAASSAVTAITVFDTGSIAEPSRAATEEVVVISSFLIAIPWPSPRPWPWLLAMVWPWPSFPQRLFAPRWPAMVCLIIVLSALSISLVARLLRPWSSKNGSILARILYH